ncbi:putative transcription factor B3-Domain family [Medicago truncatula]|uniref:Putative transcription factor B3-Domain family n=1 Tax=Medicago truncatula TaxID=3880 RepID=A0A396JL93_MEDTR|nr:putative transcription factor B3-Domain family [Medicago truncatula]
MTKKAKRCSIAEANNKKSNNKNPSFELKLTQFYAQGNLFRIPSKFSREYLNEFEGIARIRVGDDRTWKVNVKFDYANRSSIVSAGWNLFTKENNLRVGDVCKFMMTQSEPLSFYISISRAREEPSPRKLQGYFLFFIICFLYLMIFSSRHIECRGNFVELKVMYYARGSKLYASWRKIKKECKLEIKDICYFELIDEEKFVFKVSFEERRFHELFEMLF